jgi:hypothetical protein
VRVRPALVVLAAAVLAAPAARATPPKVVSGVDVFGQADRKLETAGRPVATTLLLFRSRRDAAPLPLPAGPMRPLADVVAHMRGDPGTLILRDTRRVATAAGDLYLVPTRRGWLCEQAPSFATCHRGLLRQGVTWSFYSHGDGIDVVGVAADRVRAVTLRWGAHARRAALADNVFFVHRPVALTSARHLPPFGRLVVTYRDGSRARVPLR